MSRSRSLPLLLRIALYSGLIVLLMVELRAPKEVKTIVNFSLFACLAWVVSYYSFCAMKARLRSTAPVVQCLVLARAKAPGWFYFGVAAIWLSLILIFILIVRCIVWGGGDWTQPWLGYILGLFAVGFLYSWLGGYQLRLSRSQIEYWSLFGGYRSLSSDQIRKARIGVGEFRYTDRFRPTIRLEILPASLSDKASQPIIVNLKVFRKENMDRVFDWLGPKLHEPDRRNPG